MKRTFRNFSSLVQIYNQNNGLLDIIIFSLLITVAASCNFTSLDHQQGKKELQEIINEFENQLNKDVKDDNLNGCISAAIVKGNEVLWSNAFGTANVGNNTNADSTTIYRIGSISKSFTAFLMMQLVQEGTLTLDEPIEKYLPEIRQVKDYSDSTQITFRQLASHMSGLSREPDLKNSGSGSVDEWQEKVLLCIPTISFKSRPNERYSYSNIGYAILGLALSRASNESFISMVTEKIFKPLNMNNSYFMVPEDKVINLARGMAGGPIGSVNTESPERGHKGRGYKVPNGSIYSTSNDLAKFMICNMGYSEQLKREGQLVMQNQQTPLSNRWSKNYGLGFNLYQDSTISAVYHSGMVAGYIAQLIFDKESEYGVVILRNYNWGLTDLTLRSTSLLRKLKSIEKMNNP